ncbi:MAG: DEAD/DEAH box helicase family protein, partial [Burkholderiales bacterium]|nr:DEAD/DEAH box helicase family protein [Burkholderiales bacterium]
PRYVDALLATGQPLLAEAALRRYEANIAAHEARLAAARGGLRLTYFQWLAALAVEVHLDGFARQGARWAREIEAWRAAHAPYLSPYTADDARRLALFMATGAGKTLLAHVNLLQFLHYAPFAPDNILLVTPNPSLSRQHEAELAASGLAGLGVRIVEITKLYVDAPGAKRPRKGVSEPVSRYEGPNLLLVDEGHKGGKTAADVAGEREFRAIRDALAAGATSDRAGFTFEYSATFAQIADLSPELYDDYAKCVATDFGYARFWRGGYGKDPRVVNARDRAQADRTLAAGLFSFYQQVRLAAERPHWLREYRIAPPLMLFLGRSVTASADSDLVELLRFLNKAAGDAGFLAEQLGQLSQWSRPAQGELGGDALDFRLLAALEPAQAAEDLQRRLFGGGGGLEARVLSDAEIGLRAVGAADDAYCGLVRVGEARKLAELLRGAGLRVGEADRVTGEVFGRVEEDARIRFLVGAKKFTEGWSSWRVSALGLLNVGREAGSEIVQMFGRGVRLRGRGDSLKRSGAEAPRDLKLLETLYVFGVRADYMQTWLAMLAREGIARHFELPLAAHDPPLEKLGLMTLAPDDAPFPDTVVFDGATAPAPVLRIDGGVRASVGLDGAQTLGPAPRRFAVQPHWLPPETAYQAALRAKRANGWSTLVLAAAQVEAYLRRCAVEAPADYFADPATAGARRTQAALECLERGLAATVRAAERRFRMARLRDAPLTDDNAGLPWIEGEAGRRLAYALETELHDEVGEAIRDFLMQYVNGGVMPPETLRKIEAVLAADGTLADVGAQVDALLKDWNPVADVDCGDAPLPRLHFDRHLYRPLLVAQPWEAAGGQLAFALDGEARLGVRAAPPPLNAGEARFVWDLREFWKAHAEAGAWRDCALYLLRNPAAGGVTLFRTAGFAPDFMLWLTRGGRQALAFVDPKGIERGGWPHEKIALLRDDLPALRVSIPVRGWIVAPHAPPAIDGEALGANPAERLARERVLTMDSPAYIGRLLDELHDCLQRP